jgi:hypothetical protein
LEYILLPSPAASITDVILYTLLNISPLLLVIFHYYSNIMNPQKKGFLKKE